MCGVEIVEDVELALDENNLQSSVEVEADLPVLEHAVTEMSNLAFPFVFFLLKTKNILSQRVKVIVFFSLRQLLI